MKGAKAGDYDPEKGPEQLLNQSSAAAYLGVSTSVMSGMLETGTLPRVDLGAGGGQIRVPLPAIREYMAVRVRMGDEKMLEMKVLPDLRPRTLRNYIWNQVREEVEARWVNWFEEHGVDLERIDPKWRMSMTAPDDGPEED